MIREREAANKLTIAGVARAIDIPVAEWSGNCYAIACAILRAKLVKGRPAYGHWNGPVHPRSLFARQPLVRHGWVVLAERGAHAERPGLILDPTRWVFEHVAPYLYIGSPLDAPDCVDCGHTRDAHDDETEATCGIYSAPEWPYDEGGDRFRAATQRPMPDVAPGEKVCVRLALPRALRQRFKLPGLMTLQQAAWVANLPYSVMGRDAWSICKALEAAGHKAYIPMDTWTRADAERGL